MVLVEGFADLHVHTSASDGRLSSEGVVELAASLELAGIGITDHDTVAGILPALAAGERVGITVVPGIEINTDFGKTDVHILGYYIDYESVELISHIESLRAARHERGERMVEKLNEIGVKIDFERVKEIAGSASLGRPHVARAIVEAGYTSGMNGAFGKFLVYGAPGYVPRSKLTPAEAVKIILAAGGVPVMAHPGQSKHDEIIPSLVEAGLQGLEAFHTDHSSVQRKHYVRLAKKLGLIATGGSDYHGPGMMKNIEIGNAVVGMDVVERLKELSESNRTRKAEWMSSGER
jgi:hypothetical protein